MITSPQAVNIIENGGIVFDVIRLGGSNLPVTINQGSNEIIDLAPADVDNIVSDFIPSYTAYLPPVSGPKLDFGSNLGQQISAKIEGNVTSDVENGLMKIEFLTATTNVLLGSVTEAIVRTETPEDFFYINNGFIRAPIDSEGVKIRLTSERGNLIYNSLKFVVFNMASAI